MSEFPDPVSPNRTITVFGMTYTVRAVWPYILCGRGRESTGPMYSVQDSSQQVWVRSNLSAAQLEEAVQLAAIDMKESIPRFWPRRLNAAGKEYAILYVPEDEVGDDEPYRIDHDDLTVFVRNDVSARISLGVIDTARVQIETELGYTEPDSPRQPSRRRRKAVK